MSKGRLSKSWWTRQEEELRKGFSVNECQEMQMCANLFAWTMIFVFGCSVLVVVATFVALFAVPKYAPIPLLDPGHSVPSHTFVAQQVCELSWLIPIYP